MTVKPAVKADKPETQVITEGDGNPVVANKKAMFNIYLAQGADGKKLYSSSDQGTPSQVAMNEKEFFKVIIDSLVGKPQGSRVAIAATKNYEGVTGTITINEQRNATKSAKVLTIKDGKFRFVETIAP